MFKLAESDAQYRKRRAKEDSQAVEIGKRMAALDQARALGGKPLQYGIRRDNTPLELQYVDVPTGDMFNTDDFNRYLSTMGAIGRTKFYKDKVDDYYTLNRQNMDIEMMNPGGLPKKPINPETGKPFETMERYNAIQELKKGMIRAELESQGGKSFKGEMKLRKAEDSPLPGDVVDAKLEPGEYVLNRNAVKAIGKEKLDKINNKIKPRFSDKVKSKARRLGDSVMYGAGDDWRQYLQTGGEIVDLRGMEDEMGFGTNPYADAEELGEQTIQKGLEFGKRALGGAKDLLGKAYGRFGGDAYKASKAMNIRAGATDSDGNPISIDQARKMRDEYGLGKGDLGMALGQAGQRVIDDAQTALGAGVAGAGAIANKAQELYGKASDKYQEFKPKAKKYLESEKFQKGASKGLGMAGEFFKEMAAMRGFGEGGDFDQFKPKALKEVKAEETPETKVDVDSPEMDKARQEAPGVVLPQSEEMEEFREENPYIARPETQEPSETPLEDITNPLGGITGMGGQQGGYVTMQGFIKQSLENMYGRN